MRDRARFFTLAITGPALLPATDSNGWLGRRCHPIEDGGTGSALLLSCPEGWFFYSIISRIGLHPRDPCMPRKDAGHVLPCATFREEEKYFSISVIPGPALSTAMGSKRLRQMFLLVIIIKHNKHIYSSGNEGALLITLLQGQSIIFLSRDTCRHAAPTMHMYPKEPKVTVP